MIFHLTQKLARKIKLHPLKALQAAHNPFIDWTAHLFTVEHTQYIMITNSFSLYSMVMYGRGITDDNEFTKSALNFMRELTVNDGCEFIFRRLIEPYTVQISFAKSTDRRVSGSMNDLIFHAKCLIEERHLSVFETSLKINNVPMSYIGYKYPLKAFKELKAATGGSHCPRP